MSLDACALAYRWTPFWTPTPQISSADWAEQNLILPASSNADPGPLILTKYQRGMLDAIDDPETRVAVLMMSSQTGKSTVIDAYWAATAAMAPGPALHVSPNSTKAEAFMIERLDPIVAASPMLRQMVGGGRKGGGDSKVRKMYPGGSLTVGSSHKPDDLAAKSIRYLFLDELDRFVVTAAVRDRPKRWRCAGPIDTN